MTSDAKYMLNSTQDLSAHKGHEVKITGDSSASAVAAGDKNPQSLTVTNLEMVSTTCNIGGMKHKDMDKDKDKDKSNMSTSSSSTNPK